MEKLNEYLYIWQEKREEYVILEDEYGENIFWVGGNEIQFFLLEDEELYQLIISEMKKNGNKIYKNVEELKSGLWTAVKK